MGWLQIAALAGLLCLLPASQMGRATDVPMPPVAGVFKMEIKSGGYDRVAHVHLPKGYTANSKPPVVLALHGAGGNGPMMLDRNGWGPKADSEGFIVVAPTGLGAFPRLAADFKANPNVWNSGQLNARSPRASIDDVKFIAELLDELKKTVSYDEQRVFVTGHSNGAGMTFRLGAELPERFSALAAVSGMLAVKDPKPKRPLPTLYIIGTVDPLQPLAGGEVSLPWGKRTNVPVSDYLTNWAKAIGCSTEPKTLSKADSLKKQEYPSLQPDGPTLTAIYIEGHGHEWPGGNSGLPERIIGPKTNKLNAVDTIWDFFQSQLPEE
ncbi:MAG: PHB depolymerase family esterase [Pirellulales bacterium]